MRIAVIGDVDTVNIFAMAGIKILHSVKDKWEAEVALKSVKNTPEIGVVCITYDVYEMLYDDIKEWEMDKKLYPVIFTLPEKDRDVIKNTVRKAIGIELAER